MKKPADIFNKFKAVKILLGAVCLVLFICFSAQAGIFDRVGADCGTVANLPRDLEAGEFDSEEIAQKKALVKGAISNLNDFCNKLKKMDLDPERKTGIFKNESYEEYNKRFNDILENNPELRSEYDKLTQSYNEVNSELAKLQNEYAAAHDEKVKKGEIIPCGEDYRNGCPDGKKCYSKESSMMIDAQVSGAGNITTKKYDCRDPDDLNLGWRLEEKGSAGSGNSISTVMPFYSNKITTDELGRTTVEESSQPQRHDCQVSRMREKYQSKCYSCVIVKTLIETFMTACSKVYDVSREAGIKLLFIGSLIWLVAFVIKNVSSMTNVEPATMVNSLLVFFFKVMFAAIVINAGIGVIISYMINPILTAGADFGLAIMNTTADITSASNSFISGSREAAPTIEIAQVANADGTASNIISADVMNKLVLFTENLDKTVSNNLVIGHAMTCHSMWAGAWKIGTITATTSVFSVVNMWLWFCGAAIWFVGFMLTLGICYYLLDISFKLGFAIIALPVVIGLWPFNITQGKLKDCFSIILKSAATFMFLALTTTYATVIISQAFNGTPKLLNAIEAANNVNNTDSVIVNNTEYISNIFDITGPFFIIIIIAFLYSMKLIGSTVKSYTDKFFGDSVFGSESPMHHKLTQATDFVKKKTMKAGGAALGAATGAVGKGVEKTLGKAGKFIRSKFKGSDKKKSESQNTLTAGGNTTKKAGTATKQTGKAMEQTGKTVEQTGKAAEKGGKAAAKGGQGMMKGGAALCGTGVGALIGVPMMVAGAAVFAAGKGVEYGGKAVKYGGKAMKKAGQATKKIGEKMEKAGEKMEKVGKKWQTGESGSDQPKDEQTK